LALIITLLRLLEDLRATITADKRKDVYSDSVSILRQVGLLDS
jgi:hypothetical protein